MLEVGNVGKKEQMYCKEIPPRNDALANMSKEGQSCKIFCTLEPGRSGVLSRNLYNQRLNTLFRYTSKQCNVFPVFQQYTSYFIQFIHSTKFFSFLYVLLTLPSSGDTLKAMMVRSMPA